tara:strand:+ start:21 stop:329 length:309 start_codon:yes stop_codon:yes gene_type:complete
MDIEELALYGAIGLFAVGLGYKYYDKAKALYKRVMADGKITLDEVTDIIDEIEEVVDELKDMPSLSKLRKMRKSEVMNLCKEHGIDTKGTKDQLIERLSNMK